MGRVYEERATTYSDPHLPGIIHVTVEDSNKEHKLFYEWYHFAVITKCPQPVGIVFRGVRETIEVGTLYLIEPGETTVVEGGIGGGSSSVFLVAPDVVNQAAREFGESEGNVRFPNFKCNDPEVLDHYEALAEAMREGMLLEKQSCLASFLTLLLERFAGKSRELGPYQALSPAVEKARQRILESYSMPIRLDELSTLAGMSPFALARAFTAAFGISPHDYLIKVRLGKAQDLIGTGTGFAAAAAEVGFADQSHFIRHFKRVYCATPGEFWKGQRE